MEATAHELRLLRGAIRPGDAVCALRGLVRQRVTILRTQSRAVQHMRKALVQMNIQLASVIADVAGASGQAILRAIVAGARDRHALAALCDVRVKAGADAIAASLQGHWWAEHLFALKQALAAFDFFGTQLAECDGEIAAQLQRLQAHYGDAVKGKNRSKAVSGCPSHLEVRGRDHEDGVHLTFEVDTYALQGGATSAP